MINILLIILKAMLVGVLGSIPVGPIVVFTFQRTLNDGRWAGMASAMGAVVSDTVFAVIALFAFDMMSNVFLGHSMMVELIGGLVILAIGIGIILKKSQGRRRQLSTSNYLLDSGRALLMGFLNPGGLLWIIAAFASFGFDSSHLNLVESVAVVAGVFVGSLLYWAVFTYFVSRGEKGINYQTLLKINTASGVAVAIFGLFFIVKSLVNIL